LPLLQGSSQSDNNWPQRKGASFCFFFSTNASHREEEIQIVLEPEEARTKMRLDEQQVVSQVFLLNFLYTRMLHREEEIQILVGSR
jgi:hypothetical protein